MWPWVITGALLVFLTFALDPPGVAEQTLSGSVVANHDPGYIRTDWNTLTVKLSDGRIVSAETPADHYFPYVIGAPVSVVIYRTLVFRKYAYRAFPVLAALTVHSSRNRFAVRLNTGVRPHEQVLGNPVSTAPRCLRRQG